MDITEEQAQDEERKRCEQCQAEKDIGLFRKVTNMYTAVHRMSICKECYITNQKATQQRIEEEFQRRKEEQERLEEQRQQERQSALEQAMRDNPVFCKRCNQLRIDGSHLRPDGSVGYKGKFCEACRDNNPHTIYRMRCPLMKTVRYIGITTQSLNKRLTQHMRDNGTEYKQYWIDILRRQGLKPLMEVACEAPNEEEAKLQEMRYIYHHIQRGDPLVNGDATIPQLVLSLQSSTKNWLEASKEEINHACLSDGIVKLWSMSWGIYRKPLWLHRNALVYLIQNGKAPYLFSEYDPLKWMREEYIKTYPTIMAHDELPTDLKERESILSKATIIRLRAYTDAIVTPLIEQDCIFLLSRNIPIQVDDYTKDPSTSGRLIAVDYPRQGKKRLKAYEHGKLLIHPYGYCVPSERAIAI